MLLFFINKHSICAYLALIFNLLEQFSAKNAACRFSQSEMLKMNVFRRPFNKEKTNLKL